MNYYQVAHKGFRLFVICWLIAFAFPVRAEPDAITTAHIYAIDQCYTGFQTWDCAQIPGVPDEIGSVFIFDALGYFSGYFPQDGDNYYQLFELYYAQSDSDYFVSGEVSYFAFPGDRFICKAFFHYSPMMSHAYWHRRLPSYCVPPKTPVSKVLIRFRDIILTGMYVQVDAVSATVLEPRAWLPVVIIRR